MYDGIVLDIPFAYFFLSRLLGLPSSLNELQFLDKDLFRCLQPPPRTATKSPAVSNGANATQEPSALQEL